MIALVIQTAPFLRLKLAQIIRQVEAMFPSSGTTTKAEKTPSATTFPLTSASGRCPRTLQSPRPRATSGKWM
ncbi:Forkhead box protein H1 [Lemmus lemmus]